MVRSNLTDKSIAIGVYQGDEAEVYFISDIRNETETTTFRQQQFAFSEAFYCCFLLMFYR